MKLNLLHIQLTTIICLLILANCRTKKNTEFHYHHAGYYYKIIAFDEEGLKDTIWQVARLSVAFKNQADSVFWDSYNNLSDNYFVRFTRSDSASRLDKCISTHQLHDSLCVLIKVKDFYKEQFGLKEVPFFSAKDTVVKVYFKIKELLKEQNFVEIRQDLEKKEAGRLLAYFGSREYLDYAKDEAGFYWVEKPDSLSPSNIKEGDVVNISYQGSFLNGRFLEKSPQNFELIYGTPDQLLKGLNYVITRLNVGQNAKIILPSRLAFGEKGSCNGTVPPFTPLVYEIKINNITSK